MPNVDFPRPVRPLVSRDVLVETFLEGVPVSSFVQKESAGLVPTVMGRTIGKAGVMNFLKMVLVDNFVVRR